MRLAYIDCAKGVGILCITLMHFCNNFFPEEICIFMGSFMITIFYITSGWLFCMKKPQKSLTDLCKARWHQIGRPYIYWSLIFVIFDAILCLFHYYTPSVLLQDIYKTVCLKGIGTLWFLPALFFGEILWVFLKNKKILYGFFIILALTYKAFYTYAFVASGDTSLLFKIIRTPLNALDNILMAAIYISTGYFSYNLFKNQSETKTLYIGLILLVLGYISAIYVNILVIWHLIAPVLGPIGLLLLCRNLSKYKVSEYFVFWGNNSLFLMVTHYSIMLVLIRICVVNVLGLEYVGLVTFISFCITMICEYLCLSAIRRYGHRVIGKIL